MSQSAMLWLAEVVDDAPWLAAQLRCFTASESARLAAIERPLRRSQFVAAHALARRALGAEADVQPDDVQIEVVDGRPQVIAPPGWQVSLSHSRQWVAALVQSSATAVGLDIEAIDCGRDIAALIETAFGWRPQNRDEGYRCWTVGEARLKAGDHESTCFSTRWGDLVIAACGASAPRARLADLLYGSSTPVDLSWQQTQPMGASHVG